MSLKQQGAHPQYPARSNNLSYPIYFTHPVVVKNIRSDEKPKGWADPFWDDMSDKDKIAVMSRVPMSSEFESRKFFPDTPSVAYMLVVPPSSIHLLSESIYLRNGFKTQRLLTGGEDINGTILDCIEYIVSKEEADTFVGKGDITVTEIRSLEANIPGIYYIKDLNPLDNTYCGPLNPKGLTGMIGRGLLGCYGPNHAADPIVTRINNGVLEMVAIQRGDTGEWAIPGGMVNRGDTVSLTLRKEFNEEALGNTLSTDDEEYSSGVHDCSHVKSKEDPEYVAKIAELQGHVDKLFSGGSVVYEGWVDDPRNTDWAWMVTVAVHFHITDDSPLHGIELRPATDATGAKWYKLDSPEALKKLYASHGEFVLSAIKAKAEQDPSWKGFLSMIV